MADARLLVAVTQRVAGAGAAEAVRVGRRELVAGAEGVDEVELRLVAHAGASPQPLHKGASGGELSRVMLALEVALAGADPVPTMVFDEVDAGVGGRAAVEIGRRLARLASRHQVIVVTHLPQVAAYADRHLVVDKSRHDGGKARSRVRTLAEDERIVELARMLAGLDDTDTGRAHAEELLEAARSHRAADRTRRARARRACRTRRRLGAPAPRRLAVDGHDARRVGCTAGSAWLRGIDGSGCHSLRMKLSGLLQRTRPELPGVAGTARVDRRTDALVRRVKAGEVAVLDQVDLDRTTADALVAAGVVGVVNASPSISGRFPNLGPEILIDAGIALVDDVGAQALHKIKDGSRIRLHEGVVYAGEFELARGFAAGRRVRRRRARRGQGGPHPPARGVRRQHHGVHAPGAGVAARRGRHPGRRRGAGRAAGGRRRRRVRPRRRAGPAQGLHPRVPAGAGRRGAGADTLRAAGHAPALIVGDPSEISNEALTCGADIVVPAFNDGHAPGLHRVQDLGASAVTFPSMANPEDLALLLVAHHGAAMIVTVGLSATMAEFLDRGRSGSNASTFLTRLQIGGAVVDSRVIAGAVPEPGLDRRDPAADLRRADRGGHGAVRLHRGRRGARLAHPGVAQPRRDDQGLVRVISLRYHVVSLAAVFLALAVGLVLGAGGVSDRLLGAMATKADGLTGQVQQLTAQRDALAAAQRADDEFSRRVAPAAVRGVLKGRASRSSPPAPTEPTRDALVALIQQAGATVTGTVALTPAVTDPARADQLRQLTGTLLPAGAQLPAAADTGSLLGGLLGGVLTGPSGQAPVTGPQAEGVLNGLSAAGFTAGGPAARARGPRARTQRWRVHRARRGRRRGRRHADGRPARPRGPRRRAGGLDGLGRHHRRGRRRAGRPHRHGCAVHRRQRRDRRGPDQHRAGAARAGRRARGPLRHGLLGCRRRRPPHLTARAGALGARSSRPKRTYLDATDPRRYVP